MADINKIIQVAKELGMKVEVNSSTPGMFYRDQSGSYEKVTSEEIIRSCMTYTNLELAGVLNETWRGEQQVKVKSVQTKAIKDLEDKMLKKHPMNGGYGHAC